MRSPKQTETPPDAQNGPVQRQQERGKKLWRSPRRVSGHELLEKEEKKSLNNQKGGRERDTKINKTRAGIQISDGSH